MNSIEKIEVIAEAAAFAAVAHNGQKRRGAGSIPYIVHPARVAMLVARMGGGWRAIVSAWLHDVAEDCPGYDVVTFVNRLKISDSDKSTIVRIVASLTKNPAIAPRKARFEAHIDMILHAPREAVLVKLCDRIDNLVMNEYEVVDPVIEGLPFPEFLSLYVEETKYLMEKLLIPAMEMQVEAGENSSALTAWFMLEAQLEAHYGVPAARGWDRESKRLD